MKGWGFTKIDRKKEERESFVQTQEKKKHKQASTKGDGKRENDSSNTP